jgi:hypothetical protein
MCSCLAAASNRKTNVRTVSKKLKPRKFPTKRQSRAVELGANELHTLLEWKLRNCPRALLAARRRYQKFCFDTLSRIERIGRHS